MASTLNLGAVKTPGVYIDEMSLFPPSVAQVDTAIPAFIGPTEQASKDGQSVQGVPVRISSMVEYRRYFGGAPARKSTVKLDAGNAVASVSVSSDFYLFDALTLFFANGGEKCYIVSTGSYAGGTASVGQYTQALETLRQYDEPTLIVMPDAVSLDSPGDAQQAALNHCHAMQDRFAILDVPMENATNGTLRSEDISEFRGTVTDYLNYGAAYYPYVQTSLPLTVGLADLTLKRRDGSPEQWSSLLTGTAKQMVSDAQTLIGYIEQVRDMLPSQADLADATDVAAKKTYLLNIVEDFRIGFQSIPVFAANSQALQYAAITISSELSAIGTPTTAQLQDIYDQAVAMIGGAIRQIESQLQAREAELKASIPLYAAIVAAVEAQGIVVPPSGAVAGVYARTDSDRGVWKSPANVGLNYVTGPVVRLTDRDQEGLNVDPDAGKSINAIRAFTGKGTLVWGARTLAGSDNEWRYIAVRRFFLMVEESIKKATGQFVFEANDANTWVRVRAMIENFLTLQWRAGALAGTKAENAFFVRVGLGQTMTPEDVLNGFLIVEIGMAVVRPAEFIVLRFSHKMQEA